MTLEGLLAVGGILIAAYAIMPRARQLDLKLRVSWVDWLVALTAFILVNYMQFNEFFSKLDYGMDLQKHFWGITASQLSYLVVLLAGLIIWQHLARLRLTATRIPRFSRLVQELMWCEMYNELAILLERHHSNLIRISRRQTQALRFRAWLLQHREPFGLCWSGASRRESVEQALLCYEGRWAKIRDKSKQLIAWFVRNRANEVAQAGETSLLVLTKPEFVEFLAKARPYLGLSIIQEETHLRDEFLALYMKALLEHPSSILYYEIKNNQGISSRGRYMISQENRLLHTVLANAKFAEKLQVYRPVGDYMIRELARLSCSPADDPYNLPMHDFQDSSKWGCSL